MAAAQRGRELEIDDSASIQSGRRRDSRIAEPPKGLRIAADLDDAVSPSNAGQARRRALEIGENLVFDDYHVVALGELEHAMRGRGATARRRSDCGARDGQIEPRLARRRSPPARRRRAPRGVMRRGDDSTRCALSSGNLPEIARIVDRHRVARLDQEAQRKIEPPGSPNRSSTIWSGEATTPRSASRTASWRRSGSKPIGRIIARLVKGAVAREIRKARCIPTSGIQDFRQPARAPAECDRDRPIAPRDASASSRRPARAVRRRALASAAASARRRRSPSRAGPRRALGDQPLIGFDDG